MQPAAGDGFALTLPYAPVAAVGLIWGVRLQSHNILLARDGTAKIADVGVARILTQVCPAACDCSVMVSSDRQLPPDLQCIISGSCGHRQHSWIIRCSCACLRHRVTESTHEACCWAWFDSRAAQAYVSQLGEIAGTFAWASPELLLGQRCSEKADIYAFGVVVWELATGQRPQRGQLREVL